jgi:hypothetical protein
MGTKHGPIIVLTLATLAFTIPIAMRLAAAPMSMIVRSNKRRKVVMIGTKRQAALARAMASVQQQLSGKGRRHNEFS